MAASTGDVIRVAARLSVVNSGDFVNVYHFRVDTISDGSDAAVAEDMSVRMNAIYTPLVPLISNQAAFVDITSFNVTARAPVGVTAWPTLTTGTSTGDQLPSTTAAFVRAITGASRNWAKKFIGPVTESSNQPNGTVSSTLMAALADYGAVWIASFAGASGNTYTPVVFYRSTGLWNALAEIVVRNVWSQVRRRRIGRGS